MIPRQLAIQTLADHLSDEAVVTGLGFAAMDLQTHADRALNFYIWGAMGSAVSVALGLALARPDVRVVSVDGDGSTLMNLGALSTVGRYAPSNLAVIVLDNGQFQITGGQVTAAQTTNLAAVGRA